MYFISPLDGRPYISRLSWGAGLSLSKRNAPDAPRRLLGRVWSAFIILLELWLVGRVSWRTGMIRLCARDCKEYSRCRVPRREETGWSGVKGRQKALKSQLRHVRCLCVVRKEGAMVVMNGRKVGCAAMVRR